MAFVGEDEMFDNIARAAQARRAKTESDIKNGRIARIAEDLMIRQGSLAYGSALRAVVDAKQIIKMIDRAMKEDSPYND